MSTDTATTADRPVPSGRAVRRITLYLTRLHGQGSVADVVSDVYTVVLTLVINIAMVAAVARSQGVARVESVQSGGLDLGWVALLAVLAAVGLGAGLLARLGPVSVSGAQAGWWLPLPADRRSLLFPATVRPAAVAAASGGIVLLLAALALDPAITVPGGVFALLGGAGAGAALTFGLVPLEAAGRRRVATVLGDGLLALVPAIAVVLALTSPGAPAGGGWPVLAGVAVVLAAGAALLARRTVGAIHDTELRERGAVGGELRGAAMSMDTRAIGRAISGDTRRRAIRRSTSFPLLHRLQGRRARRLRAGVALATADALVLRRSPRGLVQILTGGVLAVAALLLTELPGAVTALLVVTGGWVAALPTGTGARHGEFIPSLDTLLPMSQRAVRTWRLAVPGAVMLGWFVLVLAVAAWRFDHLLGWLALGVLAAPVWAAGVVRSAYRPPPDWSQPMVVTPMGAYHPGMASVASKGPDVVVLGAIPLVVALVVGQVGLITLGLQAVLTAVVVAIAAYPGKPPQE